MTDLVTNLERLGLEQYLDALVGEGFDTWEILLDIQESDLDSLNVKLGHRRKLQRAIADYRGIPYERLVGSPAHDAQTDSIKSGENWQHIVMSKESGQGAHVETKRKYRRHPKPDENAPDRPPSAYVIFSNKVREDVKGETLSFTAIAKLVGDRWQKLESSLKEPYETQAAAAKERYNIQLIAYKKTDAYREYVQYLADFRARHGASSEPKRPKLEPESSGGSISAKSIEFETMASIQNHARVGSIGSMSVSSFPGTLPSPGAGSGGGLLGHPGSANFLQRGFPATVRTSSPPPSQYGREPRLRGPLSSFGSTPDETPSLRNEPSDPLPRTGSLTLNTPGGDTPSPSMRGAWSSFFDAGGSNDSLVHSSRHSSSIQTPMLANQSGLAPNSHENSAFLFPSTASSDEIWRVRAGEAARSLQTVPTFRNSGQMSSMPLSSIMGSERGAELPQSLARRTLPPLRQGQATATKVSSQGFSHVPAPSHTELGQGETEKQKLPQRTLDMRDSEAANALTGLSRRPVLDKSAKSSDSR